MVFMDYSILKYLHERSAFVSSELFTAHRVWLMSAPAQLQQRWEKVVPHVVDTLLLATAIALAMVAWRTGGAQNTKLARSEDTRRARLHRLGSIALKRGRTCRTRVVDFIAASTVFAYIVSVALSKSPWGRSVAVSIVFRSSE